MRKQIFVSLIVLFALLVAGCKKENLSWSDCDRLRRGLLTEDVKMVRDALSDNLRRYSQENINKLSEAISGKCNLTVSDICFDCVYTLPAQTEIRVIIHQTGTTVEKVIDISPTSANRMKIVNVHN